jgi:hypothetical protein
MKTVSDYIKMVEDGEAAATNTVGGGAIAMKDVPLGAVQKRKKPQNESGAYEGENPLADAAGKTPLATVYAPSQDEDDDPHLFHQKQAYQNDQVMSA